MASYQGTKINPQRFSASQIKFYLILTPITLFMAIPLIYIVGQAFKPLGELFAFPPHLLPKRPTWDNFRALFYLAENSNVPIWRYIINSLIVSVSTVFFTIVITVFSAYALSKKQFRLKEALFKINQFALMFVSVAVAIPQYIIVSNLHIINTYWAHILPLLAVPVGLFLVKQFIDQLPDALFDAARIDGAGDFYIVLNIVFPLIKPAISTIAILSFQTVWSATQSSNNYTTDETMRTLAYYFSAITTNNAIAAAGMAAAASLVMFLPNLVIFIFMQSKVMSTMSHSGIK